MWAHIKTELVIGTTFTAALKISVNLTRPHLMSTAVRVLSLSAKKCSAFSARFRTEVPIGEPKLLLQVTSWKTAEGWEEGNSAASSHIVAAVITWMLQLRGVLSEMEGTLN